jgi:hypothetical protein
MTEETVRVGVANEGEITLSVSVVKEWSPTNKSQFGDTVFFKQEDTYYSMKVMDYNKIFS